MPRCVGVTAKQQQQCKTSGLYRCPQCEGYLCSWHVRWAKDGTGAWCPWCNVRMEIRCYGAWGEEAHIERVRRGWYQLKRPEGQGERSD